MTNEEVVSDHVKLVELHNELNELNLKLEQLYELWDNLMSENSR